MTAPVGKAPVLIHVPHASREIPDDVREGIVLDNEQLAAELDRMTDSWTDFLVAEALLRVGPGLATVVRAPVSRLVVDVERFPDEREAMLAVGMGAVYTQTHDGGVLRREVDPTLIRDYFEPHAKNVADTVAEMLEVHGRAVIIDVHSYPSQALPYERSEEWEERPEICLGVDPAHSSKQLVSRAEQAFRYFEVQKNTPFEGTYVPLDRYGSDERVTSVMIEIRRDTYMNEQTGELHPGAGRVIRGLAELIEWEAGMRAADLPLAWSVPAANLRELCELCDTEPHEVYLRDWLDGEFDFPHETLLVEDYGSSVVIMLPEAWDEEFMYPVTALGLRHEVEQYIDRVRVQIALGGVDAKVIIPRASNAYHDDPVEWEDEDEPSVDDDAETWDAEGEVADVGARDWFRLVSGAGAAVAIAAVPTLASDSVVDVEILTPDRQVRYLARTVSRTFFERLEAWFIEVATAVHPEQSAATIQDATVGLSLGVVESTALDVVLDLAVVEDLDDEIADYDQVQFEISRAALVTASHAIRSRRDSLGEVVR